MAAPRAPSLGDQMAAVGFTLILLLQMARLISLDSAGIETSRIDILGFAFAHILGFYLLLRNLSQGRVDTAPLTLALLFVIYTAVNIAFTAQEIRILDFLLSRYGILQWFLIGLGLAGVASVLSNSRSSKTFRRARLMMVATLAIASIAILIVLVRSSINSGYQVSYQTVANGVIIVTLVTLISIAALWDDRKPLIVTSVFILLASALTVKAVLAGSTVVAGFWIGTLAILSQNIIARKYLIGWLVISALFLYFGNLFASSEVFDRIITQTRFREFFDGSGEIFSPLATRGAILPTFEAQFSVSPLFGNFSAETVAGYGAGYYVHSLPLSLLTHTGVVGFALVMLILYLSLKPRLVSSKVAKVERFYAKLMVLILLLGTIGVFFTWSVFWFLIGFLCMKPLARNRLDPSGF